MKKYDVYGIGHALVDMELEVSDDFLAEMGIEKGVMELVDEARQSELIAKLDGIEKKRSCGGSSANTMIGLAQFGGKAFHSCKVAADEAGGFFAADMKRNGVDNNLDGQGENGTTGRCMVFLTPDAERTMLTHLGISETFAVAQVDEARLQEAEWLYIEGYLVSNPVTRAAAVEATKLAKKHGIKTALTFSDPNMVKFFRDGFDEIIGDGLDLVFCNEVEAQEFSGKDDIDAALAVIHGKAKRVCVTLGPEGAAVFDGANKIQVPSPAVKAVDANGAGDLFAGAFLFGITNGLDDEQSARLACHASSVLVTQFGARLKPGQAAEIRQAALD